MRVRQPYLRNGDEEGAVCVCVGGRRWGDRTHLLLIFSVLFVLFSW